MYKFETSILHAVLIDGGSINIDLLKS